jgi:hypothetical protein
MPTRHVTISGLMSWDDNAPDQGLPGGGGHPSHPIAPGGGSPSHPIALPPPGQAATLPVFPFDPTQPIAPGDVPHPSHPIAPGSRFVVKWLACHGLVLVPDNSLPGAPARPDQGLPGSPARPDNALPPTPQPK